jgi:hypothetical protein
MIAETEMKFGGETTDFAQQTISIFTFAPVQKPRIVSGNSRSHHNLGRIGLIRDDGIVILERR